ncbi:MAG: hypothetical protein ACOC84_00725 [Actinomycetota bacterium]
MTYQEPARLEPVPETDALGHLLTVAELDAAIRTLRKLEAAWEAELGDAGRYNTHGRLMATEPLREAITQLEKAREHRALPEDLVRAYRRSRAPRPDRERKGGRRA